MVVFPQVVCTDANRLIGKVRGVILFRALFAGEDNQSRLCFLLNSVLCGRNTGPTGYERVALPPRTIGWKSF
jgi:hypothetical protein